jgi:alkylated DNA nucleotide flippase Atl1
MAYKKKTWQEKMADKEGLPKVLKLKKKFPCFNTAAKLGAKVGDPCVLVQPKEVEAIMKRVPKGKLISIHEILLKLAKKYKVACACSLTSGIFTMQAANAAEEMKKEGKKNINPWWRTLKADGYLNEKYPKAYTLQKKLLKKEGFKIEKKGKRCRVVDFEKYLVKI